MTAFSWLEWYERCLQENCLLSREHRHELRVCWASGLSSEEALRVIHNLDEEHKSLFGHSRQEGVAT